MSRSVTWRRTISDAVSWHQDQALNSTLYILKQTGPTGFVLKEEEDNKKVKVYLGDPHTCTCQTFKKEHDLCKHICWLLLKKFKISRNSDVSWQLGLVEREINAIIHGNLTQAKNPVRSSPKKGGASDSESSADGKVRQREISPDDVCPICQEELLAKHQSVTYCRFGCGNSVHIKCMKIWVDHQQSSSTIKSSDIKCPVCRENFGTIAHLQQEYRNTSLVGVRSERLAQHKDAQCGSCNVQPITGICYRCNVCSNFYLCKICFNTPIHEQHKFSFREKTNQKWKEVIRGNGALLPGAIVNNLENRDLSDSDYDLLLALNSDHSASELTQSVIDLLPLERVRRKGFLLNPGHQCRCCLRTYSVSDLVRQLPCKHKFHNECITNWLLHQRPICPIDGSTFTAESIRLWSLARKGIKDEKKTTKSFHKNSDSTRAGTGSSNLHLNLEVPGIGLNIHKIQSSSTVDQFQDNSKLQKTVNEHQLTLNEFKNSLLNGTHLGLPVNHNSINDINSGVTTLQHLSPENRSFLLSKDLTRNRTLKNSKTFKAENPNRLYIGRTPTESLMNGSLSHGLTQQTPKRSPQIASRTPVLSANSIRSLNPVHYDTVMERRFSDLSLAGSSIKRDLDS